MILSSLALFARRFVDGLLVATYWVVSVITNGESTSTPATLTHQSNGADEMTTMNLNTETDETLPGDTLPGNSDDTVETPPPLSGPLSGNGNTVPTDPVQDLRDAVDDLLLVHATHTAAIDSVGMAKTKVTNTQARLAEAQAEVATATASVSGAVANVNASIDAVVTALNALRL